MLVQAHQARHAIHEKRLLCTLSQSHPHPFIVRLKSHNCYTDQSYLYMAMEYVPGGDLFSYLQPQVLLSESEARFFAAQVLLVLQFLHEREIVYRDLKPENLAIQTDGYIKVIDFGFAKHVPRETRTNTACGTREYMAPEIIRHEPYGKAVDWWAFGVLIFEMCQGCPPFFERESERRSLEDKILQGHFHMPHSFSNGLKNLLLSRETLQMPSSGLLSNDITLRLGNMVSGSEGVRNHEWFAPMNFDDLYNKRIRPRSTRPEYNLGENFPRVNEWDFYVNEDEDFPQLAEF